MGAPDPFPAEKAAGQPRLAPELRAFLGTVPEPNRALAERAFRRGWQRMAAAVAPTVREWERRWWDQVRENERLRARVGELLARLSQLEDRG